MGNRTRLAFSAFISGSLTVIAYLLPLAFMIYYFAPGFRLGDALPTSVVNALGGYLFPVIASVLIWTFLIFGLWLLIAKIRNRSSRRLNSNSHDAAALT